jgi:hypothetical protein
MKNVMSQTEFLSDEAAKRMDIVQMAAFMARLRSSLFQTAGFYVPGPSNRVILNFREECERVVLEGNPGLRVRMILEIESITLF